jgi:cell shape-determining protein MreC
MAEKRVTEEVNIAKKRMAKELGEWREKCTKLRAENMKFKSKRDLTISMNISQD